MRGGGEGRLKWAKGGSSNGALSEGAGVGSLWTEKPLWCLFLEVQQIVRFIVFTL